jgi:membrane protein DedA with SNARE-associated domain
MKKLLVGLMLAGSLKMAMPAFATPTTLGSFVSS